MAGSDVGLVIVGRPLDDSDAYLMAGLKSKHRLSALFTFEAGLDMISTPLRTVRTLKLLSRRYSVVLVLSRYGSVGGDHTRRLLALFVRALRRRACRPDGEEAELTWVVWVRSLLRYFVLIQKVQLARLLACGLPILSLFALRLTSKDRRG